MADIMKVQEFVIIFLISIPLFGDNNCPELTEHVTQYINDFDRLKKVEPDRDFYQTHLDKFRRFSLEIQNSNCEQRDSLFMELIHNFAEFICLPQGDLERYRLLLIRSMEIIKKYTKEIERKLVAKGESIDIVRNIWYARIDQIETRLSWLNNDYANLKIYIDKHEPFREMIRVMSKSSGSLLPVKIHFLAPKDIEKDELKRRRLAYISNNFEFVLSSYKPTVGFYFQIPLLPLSSQQNPTPDQTYAITFDDRNRFRIHNFHSEEQNSLVIPDFPYWEYIEEVPINFTKIEFPDNLKIEVYDNIGNKVDKSTTSFFVYLESNHGNIIYLPVDEKGESDYEIVMKSKGDPKLWLNTIATLGLIGILFVIQISI